MTLKIKDVTDSQIGFFRRKAVGKKVSCSNFQSALDDGTFDKVLDAIRDGLPVNIGNPIIAPPGGRIYTLRIPVVNDRDWQEAIDAAGPNTPADRNVRNVDNLYLPEGTGEEEAEMVLVNLGPSGGSWDKALVWAKQFNLPITNPRQVFALGEHHPNLHRDLGMNPMYVVATKDCTFEGNQQACCVWWHDANREADLGWVSSFGHACDWFAFLRK